MTILKKGKKKKKLFLKECVKQMHKANKINKRQRFDIQKEIHFC